MSGESEKKERKRERERNRERKRAFFWRALSCLSPYHSSFTPNPQQRIIGEGGETAAGEGAGARDLNVRGRERGGKKYFFSVLRFSGTFVPDT
jgi:hypothetical protein